MAHDITQNKLLCLMSLLYMCVHWPTVGDSLLKRVSYTTLCDTMIFPVSPPH